MAVLAFGTSPDGDENPAFSRWWAAWPREHQNGKGGARRAWKQIRPSPELALRMTEAVIAQARSDKWRRGFVKSPERWLRDECWDDYVGPEYVSKPSCMHQPECPNPQWHQAVSHAERPFSERELREARDWYRRVGIGLDRRLSAEEHMANFIRHRLRMEQ